MSVRTGWTVAVLLAGMCGAAIADEAAEPRVGDDTRAWLELQNSGNASLGVVRPMPGEVADKVYQRYLDSFDNEIPETYERESFVSSSSGGS